MRRLFIICLSVFVFVGSVGPVFAQPTVPAERCECWCGLEGRGAKSYGDAFTEAGACQTKCRGLGEQFLACSVDGDGTSPHSNLRCWSPDQCASTNTFGRVTGEISTKQAAECLPGFTYCEPLREPINLSVSLGPISQVMDLGGYIAALYQWLLGAAAVFAVIMIMVGGVQYMLSGGSSTGVTNAKKHIIGALSGVVILLASYALLASVNPQTLSLRLKPLPKLRPVLLPDAAQSCERFMELGYTVENPSGRPYTDKNQVCGKRGVITKGLDGESLSGDDKCRFQGCDKGVCRINLETDKAACHTCTEIYYASTADPTAITGFIPGPSEAVCGAAGVRAGTVGECRYLPEYYKALVRHPAQCEEYRLTCGSESDPCETYNSIQVFSGGGTPEEENLNTIQSRVQWSGVEDNFKYLCEKNACNYNAKGGGCRLQQQEGNTWTCTAR